MTPTELELIVARDHDAMARFYDRHVAMVAEFCAAVCPEERVDEAVAAVFLNFLGRASDASQDAEPEEWLRRATREVAASRMGAHDAAADERGDPVCRAMPELIAARLNGELHGQLGPVAEHLSRCPTCQATAARLGEAEVRFPVGSPGGVTELRAEWLDLAGDMNKTVAVQPQPRAPARGPSRPQEPTAPGETSPPREPSPQGPTRPQEPSPQGPTSPQEPEAAPTGDLKPPPGAPAPVRVRRGGLVGAIRRLAGAPGAGPPGRSPRGRAGS